MALFLTPNPCALPLSQKPLKCFPSPLKSQVLSFWRNSKSAFPVPFSYSYSFSGAGDPPADPNASPSASAVGKSEFVDEWGEKSDPEPEPKLKFSGPDPPKNVDEWEASAVELGGGNGSPVAETIDDAIDMKEEDDPSEKLRELKRALVDTVYGSELGFRASAEIRAEALELVSQLEAANPTPAPTERPELLDGNWILVYTAFSELLPLLAVGSIPQVKVQKIVQFIDTSSLTITNSATISTPASTSTFSASASFEVRTPSRIQVQFKEGTIRPPEIKSSIELPQSVNVLGQSIDLSSLQQALNPLQGAVQSIARSVSGLPPISIPIPGERTQSWLLTTYLDEELRISRGDGGLFVLVKEGSPLLE